MNQKELFYNLEKNITFTEESIKEEDFLLSLYASTREDELSMTSMSQMEKKNFISQQFNLRQTEYKQKFDDAKFLIIKRKKQNIGRLVYNSRDKIHLIDIAFVKKARANGFGTKIINALIVYANKQNKIFKLSVATDNLRALKLYEKLGLKIVDTQGHYYFMETPN